MPVHHPWKPTQLRWTEKDLAAHLERYGLPGAPSMADTSAPPFLPAPDPMIGGFILDLPAPISVNRIWRKTKTGVIKSAAYHQWIRRADLMLIQLGQIKGCKTIAVPFAALIVVKRSNLDLDNNSKVVLDFLQSRAFIANDALCEELTLRWGDAPTGCRVTVRTLPTVHDVLRNVAERLERT